MTQHHSQGGLGSPPEIPPPPQLLTWFAQQADISDARAHSLWANACRQTTAQGVAVDSPEYWKQTMARLRALIELESRQLDQKFALRRWARLQRKLATLQVAWMDAGIIINTRLQRRIQRRCSKLTPCH